MSMENIISRRYSVFAINTEENPEEPKRMIICL
jgi:hypothetical protein